jgi:hypothetical protein
MHAAHKRTPPIISNALLGVNTPMWVLNTKGDPPQTITKPHAHRLFASATTLRRLRRESGNEILYMFVATWDDSLVFHAMNMRASGFAGFEVHGPAIFGRAEPETTPTPTPPHILQLSAATKK